VAGGPGLTPKWIHKTLPVQIGKTGYLFQTLSLFDVWTLWPHLAPLKAALERGKPLDFQDHVVAILEILNPVLAERLKDPGDQIQKDFNPTHVDLLLNWYEREHDWSRIAALVAKTTAVEAEAAGTDPEEAHQTFVLICAAAARHCNMPMTDFIRQRFEFCADQILALHHATEQAREEAEEGKAHSWREATMKLAATFGTKPIAKPESEQPPWMREMSKIRVM
jgi:hypothetical protein